MRIGIGIDTGGTYTDAVAYDFDTKTVLASGKSLTTGEDISLGILRALDQLPEELQKKAELIGLSTTLVTNACVQNRLGRGKLIFFGDNKEALKKYGQQYGLPAFDEILYVDMKSDFSGIEEPEVDWDTFDVLIDKEILGVQGVGILEMNAMHHGAVTEKEAARRIRKKYPDMKIVCGHELFDMLNSLQRGASTLLNVNLLPVMEGFLKGFRKAVKERGIIADTVIMRSDGSLMNEVFATGRPIDTILCGPAASLMGGASLTGKDECIIVDMGGTTTDIAFMHGGMPDSIIGGVHIGRWKTFVDGLFVKTFGLGGDSAIHYKTGEMILEEYRVVPVCVGAALYPSIGEYVKKVLPGEGRHTKFLHEHFIFSNEPQAWMQLTEKELAIVDALHCGPLSLRQLSEAVGTDLYTLQVNRLVEYGVISVCGLTPTDIMHVRGDFESFDRGAAEAAAEYVAANLNIKVNELCDKVFKEVTWRMYRNIVLAILGRKGLLYDENGSGYDLDSILRHSFEMRSIGEHDGFMTAAFTTSYPLVGIGAPINVFLPTVAELLGTEAIIPKHHEVANALGAIAGSISTTGRTEVKPLSTVGESDKYIVFGREGNHTFDNEDDAIAFAIEDACCKATEEARKRGAGKCNTCGVRSAADVNGGVGTDADTIGGAETETGTVGGLRISYEVDSRKPEVGGLPINLGTVVTAHAIGKMI